MLEHTFIFADLAGFTALTEAHGDEDAADLARDFCAEVGELLPAHDAEQIKSIGDAVLLRAAEPSAAVGLGVCIVGDVGRQHGFPTIRVGMHTGPAVERAGDWFGATVNLAARVSGAASGGEVLLTEQTRKAAGKVDGVELRARGRHELRNVREPIMLFAAGREGARDVAGLPIDPVCRMAIHPDHAAGVLRFGGIGYHFCSLRCAQSFAEGPETYVPDGGS